jgi:hypothetical protein
MYIPRHWHFALSTLLSLLGFYIKHQLGNTYDVVIVFLILQYHAVMHTAYIFMAGKLYQAYITQADERQMARDIEVFHKPQEPEIKPVLRNLNEQPVYNQVVSLPHFDKERNFAVTLIRMNEYDPNNVDMTESKWVKSGKFVRAEFVGMLDKWAGHHVIIRKSTAKNAPYRVARWDAVRLIAQGNPLPPLPH